MREEVTMRREVELILIQICKVQDLLTKAEKDNRMEMKSYIKYQALIAFNC